MSRPAPWHPHSYAPWARAKKAGFRRTRWPAPLGWDDPHTDGRPVKLLPLAKGLLIALGILCAGLVISAGWIPVIVTAIVVICPVALGEVLPEATERYEVIYLTAPSWRVGEDDRDRDLTDPTRADMLDEDRYPGNYPGMVLAVKESPASWRPGDLASPNREVVGLDLTVAQANALRSREQKVDPGTYTVSTTTAADRYGATMTGLVMKFGSVEEVEAAELEAAAQEAVSTTGELHAIRTEFIKLKRALPKTIVHSGAGLYEVGPAKTYSTSTLALAQLFTDQGSASFTESQYIRIFADTYDENIQPNASLNPTETTSFTLVIEGDPNDDRDNIDVTASSSQTFNINCDSVVVRHLKVTSVDNNTFIFSTGIAGWEIEDCTIVNGDAADYALESSHGGRLKDCSISTAGDGVRAPIGASHANSLRMDGCTLIKTGSKARFGVTSHGSFIAQGTVIAGFASGYSNSSIDVITEFRNCVIYNNTTGLALNSAAALLDVVLINTIIEGNTINIFIPGVPDEAGAGAFAGPVTMRNNYSYNYTTFATVAGVGKTYAEFIAYDRVDASGNVDGIDPQMTDPGADDFSLQAGSPCKHAGVGAGVIRDVNGDLYDRYHPDIGAVSTGIGPNVAYSS